MASVKKIIEGFLRKNKPAQYKFKDVVKVLESFGFVHANTKGSHFIYEKGDIQITIVHHNKKVKKGYIVKLIKLLDLEEWFENQ